MISIMDMTTCQWESKTKPPDIHLESGDSVPRLGACQVVSLPLNAGLCEHVTAQPLYAGMPGAVATLDLGDFLARMDGA